MRFYIDYENVGAAGLQGAEKLTENDIVRIYYSNNPSITMDNVRLLVQAKAKIQFLQMPDSIKKMNLSNALDIVIMSDISRLLENNDLSQRMYIITNDCGYDAVITELNAKFGQLCFRYEAIGSALGITPAAAAHVSAPAAVTTSGLDLNEIGALFDSQLKQYKGERANILALLRNSRTRTEINNKLHQNYSQQIATTVVKTLRPYIKSLPGQ